MNREPSGRLVAVPLIMSVVSGVSFYLASRDIMIAVLASSIALTFFGGLGLYVRKVIRSRSTRGPMARLNWLRTLIFALAVAGQISLSVRAPSAVPISLVVAIALVALVDQWLRYRQRTPYDSQADG